MLGSEPLAALEKAQESRIKEDMVLVPAMWPKKTKDRQVGLVVRVTEGMGGGGHGR